MSIPAPKNVLKKSGEAAARPFEAYVEAREAGATAGPSRWFVPLPVRAELIVFPALLRVGENLVGLVDLFELVLGAPVPRVDVGMILARQLAKGLFDFLFARGLLDP